MGICERIGQNSARVRASHAETDQRNPFTDSRPAQILFENGPVRRGSPMALNLLGNGAARTRRRALVAVALVAGLATAGFIGIHPANTAASKKKTYGFVISSLFTAMNDSKYMDE